MGLDGNEWEWMGMDMSTLPACNNDQTLTKLVERLVLVSLLFSESFTH
jgi:hypothetical protein